MPTPVVVCTDLDRTLLPNGQQAEPSGAREGFVRLVSQPGVRLVYVSGRDKKRILQAIADYQLPMPDFAIADVGTSVYRVQKGEWQLIDEWMNTIARDWRGKHGSELLRSVGVVPGLQLQAADQQGAYKLSFERRPAQGLSEVVARLERKLARLNCACRCIVSVDETTDTGLVDVLPAAANKKSALEFLRGFLAVSLQQMVFSGDSGNDLDVLFSPMPATLVGNATEAVRALVKERLEREPIPALYLATGYYAAGITEGVFHYFPEYAPEQQEPAKC